MKLIRNFELQSINHLVRKTFRVRERRNVYFKKKRKDTDRKLCKKLFYFTVYFRYCHGLLHPKKNCSNRNQNKESEKLTKVEYDIKDC